MTFDLDSHINHFNARVLQDALAEALPDYWRRRAAAFHAVGDYGDAPAKAAACEHAAVFYEANVAEWIAPLVRAETGLDAPARPAQDMAVPVLCSVCHTPTSPWTCSCGQTRREVAA